jgi:Predicted glycosyl hydrolase
LIIHVVKPNETIYTIARSYGVPPSRIINDNELTEPNRLVVGQTLVILYPDTEHTVTAGDTLQSIANQYNVTVNQLLRNNPSLDGGTEIFEGQVIVIDYKTIKNGSMTVSGYAYPYINPHVLRKTLPYLTYINVFSYAFDEDGDLFDIDDSEILSITTEYDVAPILVVTTLSPEGLHGNALAHKLLNDEAMQDKLISQLIDMMREKGYYGTNIDFEYVYPEDSDNFSSFVRKADERMNAAGFVLTVALAPKTSADQAGLLYEAHDYRALGEAADWVILMTYEWGYAYGPPMAVAPIDKVKAVLDYAVTEINPLKILMGIPNYGYDWTLPFQQGTRARSLGNVEAVEQAVDVMTAIMFDETAQSPYYNYYQNNTNHVVWFEDARSIETKLNTANDYGLKGVEYWHLMKYFPQNWLVLNALYNIEKKVSE